MHKYWTVSTQIDVFCLEIKQIDCVRIYTFINTKHRARENKSGILIGLLSHTDISEWALITYRVFYKLVIVQNCTFCH